MHHYNPGAVLRQLFPKQLSSTFLILLWTFVYLLDLALVIGFNYLFVYTIPENKDNSQWPPDFSAYLDGEQLDAYGAYGDNGFHVLYRADSGERRVVWVQFNYILRRLNVVERTDRPTGEGDQVEVEYKTPPATVRFTVTDDTIDRDTGVEEERTFLGYLLYSNPNPQLYIFMAIAALLLLIEWMIHDQLIRLFQ